MKYILTLSDDLNKRLQQIRQNQGISLDELFVKGLVTEAHNSRHHEHALALQNCAIGKDLSLQPVEDEASEQPKRTEQQETSLAPPGGAPVEKANDDKPSEEAKPV